MICPHCHREQKDNHQTVCIFCKKTLYSDTRSHPHSENHDQTSSFVQARIRAEEGNPAALYRLGLCYYLGSGCTQDYQKAVHYFQDAADKGNADAQYALALCLLQGKGIQQKISLSIHYLKQASKQKHPKASALLNEISKKHRSQPAGELQLITDLSLIPEAKRQEMVHFLPNDAANSCPNDQYELTKCEGFLAYHQLEPLKHLGYVKLNMLCCTGCKSWFINRHAYSVLAASDYNLDGFDILGCREHQRHESLIAFHTPEEPEAPVKTRRRRATSTRGSLRGPRHQQHLAIKLAACDGGASENSFGYKGLCSDEYHKLHKQTGDAPWCASRKNQCRDWQGAAPDNHEYPCLESHLLIDWRLGSPKDGANDAPSHRISGDREGSIALLTTVLPGETEKERRVFAIFKINNPEQVSPGEIVADQMLRLEIMKNEPLFFWDTYHKDQKNDEIPKWGSVFYRNVSHDQIQVFLKKAVELIEEPDRKATAGKLLSFISEK